MAVENKITIIMLVKIQTDTIFELRSRILAQVASTVFCVFIAIGVLVSDVRPVGLPIDETCGQNNVTLTFVEKPEYGMVHPLQRYTYFHFSCLSSLP